VLADCQRIWLVDGFVCCAGLWEQWLVTDLLWEVQDDAVAWWVNAAFLQDLHLCWRMHLSELGVAGMLRAERCCGADAGVELRFAVDSGYNVGRFQTPP